MMRGRRLLWQLFFSYLLVLFLPLASLSWYFSHSLRQFYIDQTTADLEARARLVENQTAGHLSPASAPYLQTLCDNLGQKSATRITIILPSGVVLGDSMENPARMENHADRPEIAAALEGKVGTATRFSYTLQKNMMYVAVPAEEGGRIGGVVRAAVSVNAIDRALTEVYPSFVLGGMAAVLLAAALSLFISRRISRPIEEIRRGAERFARGELGNRLAVKGSREILGLAGAMNQMAAQLDDRIRAVLQQRNEQEAVLASMVEGVLAVDTEERVIRINGAAAGLLGVRAEEVQGRRIQEVVRKADLLRFVARALADQSPVEGDIVLRDESEQFLQAHGTVLRDTRSREIGALIVLNDVTRLRRLENIRRDFVANVSHELKTPVTAIKGSVETLLDGALQKPEDARRFLEIVIRQADRLNAIIDDLLALSRIEQEAERHEIPLQRSRLAEVLRGAVQACEVGAAAKSIRIDLSCPEPLLARINPPLLEQAVVNLIDNAVKYSRPESEVRVEARPENGEIIIRVRDHGCGIAREHLPRLFERFYRVDKARSRKEGGTGLGLAIVKHIVQAHSGTVTVVSAPGEGSTFTIHLPPG
jgi:two-component system phosphate regulon sensor histidine kinase PhoR